MRTGLQTPSGRQSGKKPQSGDRIQPGASAPGYQDRVSFRPEGAKENVADGVATPVRQEKFRRVPEPEFGNERGANLCCPPLPCITYFNPTCHPFRKSGYLTGKRTAGSLPDAQKSDFLEKSDFSIREHIIGGKLGYFTNRQASSESE